MNSVDALTASGQARVQVGNITNNYSESATNQCLRDLRLTDPRDDKKRIEQTKGGLFRDSYHWIFDNADFRRWRDDLQSRLLWIKGDAGKGKTMLLCGIIDELESAADTGQLSYFFCQGTDSQLNSATAVVRGLVYLLVSRYPCLMSPLEKKYDEAGKRLFEDQNAFYALRDIFNAILRDLGLTGAYFVIDALDECEHDLPLLLEIIKETTTASLPIKWIISSRNRPDIERHLTLHDSRIRLSLELNAQHVSHAIELYIDHKVSQLKVIEHERTIQDQVITQMRQKAEGTFLWVALVFQELQNVFLSWDVLPLLEEIPTGLTPLYHRMMVQVERRRQFGICRHVLSAVTLARRPLYLPELPILAGIEGISHINELETIIHLCGSFITIRASKVYLIHQSAKEYLQASDKIFPSSRQPAHRGLFFRSLRALSRTLKKDIYGLRHRGFLAVEVQPPEPNPLGAVGYSCVYWVDHLLDAQNPDHHNKLSGKEETEIYGFLKTDFTHWLESLSLLGELPDGVASIRRLLYTIQV